MFCHNCGKEIQRESRHCSHCGAVKIVNLAETLASSLSGQSSISTPNLPAQEECLFKIQPAFLFVALSYAWAAVFTIFATTLIAYLGGSLILVLAVSALLFAYPLSQHLKWSKVSYLLSNTKIEIQQGVIEKNSNYLALWHIQNVTVNESLLDRILGIGDVLIDSAGSANKMTLKKIREPRRYANIILAHLPRAK